jgi:hypothetical protein
MLMEENISSKYDENETDAWWVLLNENISRIKMLTIDTNVNSWTELVKHSK